MSEHVGTSQFTFSNVDFSEEGLIDHEDGILDVTSYADRQYPLRVIRLARMSIFGNKDLVS